MFRYNIKKRRLELGMTLEEVGNLVGVGKSTVRKWETGAIGNMKSDKIELLSIALKISPAEFMGWEIDDNDDIIPSDDERELLKAYKEAKNSKSASVRALASAVDKLLGLDE